MRILARFLGDPRGFSLVFHDSVPDAEKLKIARGWAEMNFWATAVVYGSENFMEVAVDVGKAYVLEPDKHGPDPLSLIGVRS